MECLLPHLCFVPNWAPAAAIKVGDIESDYFAVQAAQKLSWALAEGVTLSEAVVWNAEANDIDNYTLTATAALEVDMGANLSFRTAVSNIYESDPGSIFKFRRRESLFWRLKGGSERPGPCWPWHSSGKVIF